MGPAKRCATIGALGGASVLISFDPAVRWGGVSVCHFYLRSNGTDKNPATLIISVLRLHSRLEGNEGHLGGGGGGRGQQMALASSR